jgi:hypothetical protein|tara:strand:- start:1841 stop:2146 length:306 start_codon:yes stop_codon:yes gene_type:complete
MPDTPALGHHTYRGVKFEIVSEPRRYGRKRAVAWVRDGDEGHGFTKWVDGGNAEKVDGELTKLAWDHARAAIDRMRCGRLGWCDDLRLDARASPKQARSCK